VTLEEEVQGKVAHLLTRVCNEFTDTAEYEYVLAQLTRMSILGTRPRGCEPPASEQWSYKSEIEKPDADDFSASKEKFIAP